MILILVGGDKMTILIYILFFVVVIIIASVLARVSFFVATIGNLTLSLVCGFLLVCLCVVIGIVLKFSLQYVLSILK